MIIHKPQRTQSLAQRTQSFNKIHQQVSLFLFVVLILITGCGKKPAGFVFFPVDVREHSVIIDSENFPGQITLFFCDANFNPHDAQLSEIVGDRVDLLDFSANRAIPDSLDILVFVEDCSGSMKPLVSRADRIIHKLTENFSELTAAVVRVGKQAVLTIPPTKCKKIAEMNLDSLEYPSPKGTKLSDGIELALELIGDGAGAIVLLTDGSVSQTRELNEQSEFASAQKIPIIVLQMDGIESKTLKKLSVETNGFFAHQKVHSLTEILASGWTISYTPTVTDTNGAEHKIVLRWGAQKRIASYIAPGTPSPEPESEKITSPIPAELVEGIRVPFMNPGNARILRPTRELLDSTITLIEADEANDAIKLAIDGYTCDLGTEEFNFDLSQRRAKAVANYIRQHCTKPIQFRITAHGESDPLMPNISEPNRRANRRVEIRLLPDASENETPYRIFSSQ